MSRSVPTDAKKFNEVNMQNNKTTERKAFRLLTVIALLVCAGLSAILLTGCDNIKKLISGGSTTEQTPPRGIYTVTFDGNGGVLDDVYKLQTTPDGTLEAFPTAPTYDGKEFYCWTLRRDNLETRLSLLYAYSSDTTVYAYWTNKNGDGDTDDPNTPPLERMQCLITFDANGGTVNGVNSVTRRTDETGKLEDIPTEPVKQGQIFNGWYLTPDADSADKVLPGRIFNVDTTVYATWRDKIEYTVTFDANGGTVNGKDLVVLKTDEDGFIPDFPVHEREGYAFRGWYENFEEPYGKQYYSSFTEDTTVYAKWQQEVFVITFDANGGDLTGEDVMETGTDGRLEAFPTDPTNSDDSLYFIGWGLRSDAEGGIPLTYVFHSDTTLYAVWTDDPPDGPSSGVPSEPAETFTLSFYRNYSLDDQTVDNYTFPKGKVLVRFPELVRDGYEHAGWMISSDDANIVTIGLEGYTVTRDASFYAKWEEKQTIEPSEPVRNSLSGLDLEGRVYEGNGDYIQRRERELTEAKNQLNLSRDPLGENRIAYFQEHYIVQGGYEFNAGQSLQDEDGQDCDRYPRAPEIGKYGFLFDYPTTKAAFTYGFGNMDYNFRTQLSAVSFSITPADDRINLDDYEITLETTASKGWDSGVAMEYFIRYDSDGKAYIDGVLTFTYTAMATKNLAAFVKVTAKNPALPCKLSFQIEEFGEWFTVSEDLAVRERFIKYEDGYVNFFYELHMPYVFMGASTSPSSSIDVSPVCQDLFRIRYSVNPDFTDGHIVVDLELPDEISTVTAEYMSSVLPSVSFMASGGVPVPVKVDLKSGAITLDYFFPTAFEFNVVFNQSTGGYYVSWHCGGGMDVAKIIFVSPQNGPMTYDVSGKEYIDLLQREAFGDIVFVLA